MHSTRTLWTALAAVCAVGLVGCTGQLPASAPTTPGVSTPAQPGSPTPGPSTPAAAPTPPRTATPDFDGDGAVDLATAFMGDLEETRIAVRYGSGSTVEITAQETILDEWGEVGRRSMLAADLNADGYSDLVFAGVGLESGSRLCELFGSAGGLQVSSLHCVAVPGADDRHRVSSMGLVLDPVPLLVIGVSTWWRDDATSGRVLVYPLGEDGRAEAASAALVPGTGGVPELDDKGSFGESLAVAGHRLFVGASKAEVGGVAAGAVVALDLTAEGVASGEVISQAGPGVPGEPAKGDRFGASLAARDGHLAIGVPGDQVGAIRDVGAVQLFTLSDAGHTSGQRVTQATDGIPGKPERGDRFGSAVAIGTVCPGVTGVVVGAPGEAVVDDHEGDGSGWIIPLEVSDACPARQLWEGHGLGGAPQYWRRLGEQVAVIRDGAENTDRIVIAGEGLVSDLSPFGALTVWSTRQGRSLLHVEECIRGIAGR